MASPAFFSSNHPALESNAQSTQHQAETHAPGSIGPIADFEPLTVTGTQRKQF
jgi:hypothetical protein